MIAWKAFKYQGIKYDLSHLHPTQIQYIQPGKGNNPKRTFKAEVCYSLHCFSKTLTTLANPHLNYSDAKETRTFDIERYKLSIQLPRIIQCLDSKKCMHTGHGKFYVVESICLDSINKNYEVYFNVSRSTIKGIARIFVQSAYVRDSAHSIKRSSTKKISLYVILNNKLANKLIRIQPQK